MLSKPLPFILEDLTKRMPTSFNYNCHVWWTKWCSVSVTLSSFSFFNTPFFLWKLVFGIKSLTNIVVSSFINNKKYIKMKIQKRCLNPLYKMLKILIFPPHILSVNSALKSCPYIIYPCPYIIFVSESEIKKKKKTSKVIFSH